MTSFLTILALNCSPTLIHHYLGPNSWDNIDYLNLKQAKRVCSTRYRNSPCLKYFNVVDFRTYRAICSKKN